MGKILTLCGAGIALLVLAGCKQGSAPEPIFVAHLAASSGPDKEIGERTRQAILLAVEEINKDENRILGRPIKVLQPEYPPEDTDKVQAVALRLIDVNRVAALLGGGELGEVGALERAAQPYEVPLIVSAELPQESVGENVFSVNTGLAFQAQTLAQFAKQELKAIRVAVLVDARKASCTTLAALFAREFARTGAINEWSYKTGSDLPDLVERVKKLQPSVVLHAGTVGDLGQLRGKLQAAAIKMPIIFAGDINRLGVDRDATDGVYVATPYLASDASKENEAFVKNYKERFNQLPDVNAALAYDAIRLLFEAMRRAQSIDRPRIDAKLVEMATNPFDKSVSGAWTFDKNHAARRPLFVGKVEDGKIANPKSYTQEQK